MIQPYQIIFTFIFVYNYYLYILNLAIVINIFSSFKAKFIENDSSSFKIIRIIKVFRFFAIYKTKRDFVIIEFENIHKKNLLII